MSQRRIVYRGRRIDLAIDTLATSGGTPVEREVVLHPGAVAIVPLLDADHVCLIRNYRHSVGQTLLELPAGTLEPGEPPDAAAVRELAEETGYTCRRIRRLIDFYVSPGVLTERMFLYVAEELTPGTMRLDPGETLTPEVVAWSDALQLIERGVIQDAKSIIGLLYCDRLSRPYGVPPLQ
jgi:ADP-ribose pyrophosphatase